MLYRLLRPYPFSSGALAWMKSTSRSIVAHPRLRALLLPHRGKSSRLHKSHDITSRVAVARRLCQRGAPPVAPTWRNTPLRQNRRMDPICQTAKPSTAPWRDPPRALTRACRGTIHAPVHSKTPQQASPRHAFARVARISSPTSRTGQVLELTARRPACLD